MSLSNQTWKRIIAAVAFLALLSVLNATNCAVADQTLRRMVRRTSLGNHRVAGRAPKEINRLRPASTVLGQRKTRIPHNNEFNPANRARLYFVTVFEAQYRRPNESGWRRLGTYATRLEADRALFLAYDRGHIPSGSRMRIVERRRRGTPPPAMETKFFVVYRPPGERQRELGPYDTRREAELALFRGVERGQIPPGSGATIREREVPVE